MREKQNMRSEENNVSKAAAELLRNGSENVLREQIAPFWLKLRDDIYGGYIVAIAVALAIIFMGLFISRRKRDAFNSNADMMNRIASERYQLGLKNERMIDIYQDNLANMRRYEDLVPAEYQTSQKVSLIIEALKEDKADTVEEAIALL